MSKGKFEAGKKGKAAGRSDPYAVKNKPTGKYAASGAKLWPILAAVAGVAVLVVGILILTGSGLGGKPEADGTTGPLQGLPRAQIEARARELDTLLRQDLTLTLTPENPEPTEPAPEATTAPETTAPETAVPTGETAAAGETEVPVTEAPVEPAPAEPVGEEPIVITLSAAESGAGLDLTRLQADLDAGKGKEAEDSYVVDLEAYLTLKDTALRSLADRVAAEYGTEFVESSVEEEDAPPVETQPKPDEDDEDDKEEGDETPAEPLPEPKLLVLRTGVTGRSIRGEDVYQALNQAYRAVFAEEPVENPLQPTLTYEARYPKALDVETLYKRYCKDPVDAELDVKTGEIKEGKNGFGFDKEELTKLLAEAQPGAELKVLLQATKPAVDKATLEATLFQDVLAEAHTPHTSIYNRTNNLILACEAIDGTVLMPGDVFSFNKVVGERTEAKGYKEAIAYVHGGASKPELGGGVCQVASSIYYAVLQADLKTVERSPHMYLVDYVPSGMDTTIYWGYLDYKFENNTPSPIKIQASVSDGKVHIVLLGTEWKDYTVELSYEVLSTTPWETVEQDVPNDGTYSNGEVITTPYTGYKVATYKTTYDKSTGKKLETTEIAVSNYSKRDKVIARVVSNPQPTQPTPEPTQPTPEPTEPTPEPTPEPTEPIETEAPPVVTEENPPEGPPDPAPEESENGGENGGEGEGNG